MQKIILVRHGETSKNLNNKIHDNLDPEELNDNGVIQIQKTAKILEKYNPTVVYSSKEKRAIQSANIISANLNIQLKEIDNLQERNWGQLSGKPWSEIQAILDPLSLEERFTYIPPKGESWQTFESRLIVAVDSISDNHLNETFVIVTHGGVIRVLMPYLLGAPKEESFNYDPTNASITIFEKNNNQFKPVMINNTDHLINQTSDFNL